MILHGTVPVRLLSGPWKCVFFSRKPRGVRSKRIRQKERLVRYETPPSAAGGGTPGENMRTKAEDETRDSGHSGSQPRGAAAHALFNGRYFTFTPFSLKPNCDCVVRALPATRHSLRVQMLNRWEARGPPAGPGRDAAGGPRSTADAPGGNRRCCRQLGAPSTARCGADRGLRGGRGAR